MAFFHNRTVNLLNLHTVIGTAAQSGGGAFFSIYLLKSGIGVPGTLLALAALFAARLVLRTMLLPFAIRFGLKRVIILGNLVMAIQFVFLAHVTGANLSLIALLFVGSLGDTIYWPSYHAYFAAAGDEAHRGQQLGIREAVNALIGIVSPLFAGLLLVTFGPYVAFYVTAAIQALATVPLLFTPDVKVARSAPGAFRAALSGASLFVADGLIAAGYFVVWQVALFLALGENIMAYGGALAIAAAVGAVSGLFLGKLIDAGRGGRAVWIAAGVTVFVIVLRAFSLSSPLWAVTANALGAFVSCLYIPTMMTAVYNQAKRSPCVMRFHIAAEGGWDIGISSGLALAALMVWLGRPIGNTVLIALIGAAIVFVILRRYYAEHRGEAIDLALDQGEDAKI
jgi:MFS transporter